MSQRKQGFKKKMIDRLLQAEADPRRLAWSMSLGVYLAFSPYLGIQTFLVFLLAFVFSANAAVIMIVLYTVNNPWTMLPIAALDYSFGHWLSESFLQLNLSQYDPAWMGWVNAKIGSYLTAYLGIEELCFWSFMLGGNIIAFTCAAISYPFAQRFCAGILKKYGKQKIASFVHKKGR